MGQFLDVVRMVISVDHFVRYSVYLTYRSFKKAIGRMANFNVDATRARDT